MFFPSHAAAGAKRSRPSKVRLTVGRAYRLSQTEYLLETAIRLAPQAPFSGDAFALLEEFVASGYTGSAGTHVPPDVQRHLDELERLIDAS